MLTLIVDELIRQITIQCLERGYLLVRVREELRMTVEAYQSLYESSIAYGMRKTILAEKRRNDMDAQILQLERECGELQSSVDNLEKTIIDIEKEFKETQESLENKHNEVVKEAKARNMKLKEELNLLLCVIPPKPDKDKDKKK